MYGEPDAVSISLVPSISLSKYLDNSLLQSKYLKILPLQSKKSKNKSYFYKKGESNKFLYISPFFVKKSLDYMRFFLRKNLYKKNIWYRILNKEEVET